MVGLMVSWVPPESNCTVNSYDMQYRRDTSGDWNTVSTMSMSYQLSGLQLGSTYYIQVRAVSDAGNGPWSDEIEEITYNGMISRQLIPSSLHIVKLQPTIVSFVRQTCIVSALVQCHSNAIFRYSSFIIRIPKV